MKTITRVALALACYGSVAHAMPIATTGIYSASAVAIIEPSLIDTQDGSSPPGALPLLVSASSSLGFNSAFGTGIADDGFLSAGTDITSEDADASALGYAEFTGTFVAPNSAFRLHIDVSNTGLASGQDATAETVFGLNLMAGLTTLWSFEFHYPLFNDTALLNQAFDQMFSLPTGTLADLTVYVLTTANVLSPGEATNLASIQFDLATVPEPTTLFSLMAGLALMGYTVRKRDVPSNVRIG